MQWIIWLRCMQYEHLPEPPFECSSVLLWFHHRVRPHLATPHIQQQIHSVRNGRNPEPPASVHMFATCRMSVRKMCACFLEGSRASQHCCYLSVFPSYGQVVGTGISLRRGSCNRFHGIKEGPQIPQSKTIRGKLQTPDLVMEISIAQVTSKTKQCVGNISLSQESTEK